jgi:hypothetical protein
VNLEIPLCAALASLVLGCPTSRPAARCVIVASPADEARAPPQLSIMGANPVAKPARMSVDPQVPVHCGGPLLPGGGYYPDSPVDDLTSISRGASASDGQSLVVCPAFPAPLVEERSQIPTSPCGPAACANRQFVFARGDVQVHFLFYDDPSRHRSENAKQAPSGACFYRLYAVSVAWDGKGPQ